MSAGSSYDAKERIKAATDIVELVGSYLQLRREGRGFKALCPWHDDSRPSLQVNPERQSWKCWVCDLGGDVFSFVMQKEQVTFPEALAMLADRAGIALDPAADGLRGGASPDEKRQWFAALAWAEKQFHECLLHAPEAEVARRYLQQRHSPPTASGNFAWALRRTNGIGWPTGAAQTTFSAALLERVGLFKRRSSGPGHYDFFKGRLLFPIYDMQGRPVAAGGRVLPTLDPGNVGKYINSPETPLFSKSKLLYGLHAARESIRKTGVALVTEGYTDCIVAHQFGFTNCVAVLGTALGMQQIRTLSQCGPTDRDLRIVLRARRRRRGAKRANEVLELFLAANADVRVLTLPDDADPCEFLLEQGPRGARRAHRRGARRAGPRRQHRHRGARFGATICKGPAARSKNSSTRLPVRRARRNAPTTSAKRLLEPPGPHVRCAKKICVPA